MSEIAVPGINAATDHHFNAGFPLRGLGQVTIMSGDNCHCTFTTCRMNQS